MKVYNVETLEFYENHVDAYHNFCCKHKYCAGCCLYTDNGDCEFEVADDVAKPLNRIGYSVICDRPKICEILGVEVGEMFEYGGSQYKVIPTISGYTLKETGFFDSNAARIAAVLTTMLDNPGLIVRCNERETD